MVLNQCTAVQNEEEVGKAINESGVPRSEIWITSKVCQMRAIYIARELTLCNSYGIRSMLLRMSNLH